MARKKKKSFMTPKASRRKARKPGESHLREQGLRDTFRNKFQRRVTVPAAIADRIADQGSTGTCLLSLIEASDH